MPWANAVEHTNAVARVNTVFFMVLNPLKTIFRLPIMQKGQAFGGVAKARAIIALLPYNGNFNFKIQILTLDYTFCLLWLMVFQAALLCALIGALHGAHGIGAGFVNFDGNLLGLVGVLLGDCACVHALGGGKQG